MQKIFIDSNIYLGFYNSNKPEFKKLIASLIELADKILVTYQIIDEIDRNKLKVFSDSIGNYVKQSAIILTRLPEHFDEVENTRIKDWNTKRKELENTGNELNKELGDILLETISKVARSEDKISKELKKVFRNPLKAIDKQFGSAKMRREIGNPPGKIENPLGDQLNWVQLLENVKGITQLYIVSNDYDYFVEYGQQLFLNPLLYKELKNINPNIKVHVYNKLSKALIEFSNTEHIDSLPPEKELKQIMIDEPELGLNPSINKRVKFYGGGHGHPVICPQCLSEKSFTNGSYLPSIYGGLTYQFMCTNCGYHYDTGDYWD